MNMRKFLSKNKLAASFLFALSLILLIFGVLFFRNYRTFSYILWVSGVPLIILIIFSFSSAHRFRTLFNCTTIIWGCIYSLILSADVLALMYTSMLRGFGLSKHHPIRMVVLNYSSVLLLLLFLIALVIDAVKFKPDLRAGLSRFLIGGITFLPFCCLLLGFSTIFD